MAKQEKEKNNQKHFWKDFKAELKKVIWPTKKQLANNTLVVIGMVLITTVIVLVLDLAFEALNTYGINKIKEAVQDSNSATVVEDENNNDEEESNNEENSETDNEENTESTDTDADADENNEEGENSEDSNESEE